MFPCLNSIVTSARIFERIVRLFDEERHHLGDAVLFKEGQIVHTEPEQ